MHSKTIVLYLWAKILRVNLLPRKETVSFPILTSKKDNVIITWAILYVPSKIKIIGPSTYTSINLETAPLVIPLRTSHLNEVSSLYADKIVPKFRDRFCSTKNVKEK